MPETVELSDAKRKLLTKYLSGKTEFNNAVPRIPRRAPGEPIPLSFEQEQVWLHAQMAPDVPLYNEAVTIHHTGPLDVVALERSLNEILRRHEAWRTSFVTVDGTPMQQIEPSINVSLPVIDLRVHQEALREAEALRIATEDAQKPLDLAQAPLFRANLIRLQDDKYRLYLTLSHIIFDGVAIYRVFLPELCKLYEAFVSGKPSPLPELLIQHGDYCSWQRKSFSDVKVSEHMEYWSNQLGSGSSVVELPTDRARPPIRSSRGSMYPFVLGPGLSEAIRQVSHREGVSSFQLLLASFAALLRRYSGNDQITIGTVTAGRDCPETEILLGYFLKTVPMRVDLSCDPTFRELAKRIRNVTVEILKHDSVPLSKLIRDFGSNRDFSRNPFFDVMFSLDPPMLETSSAWNLTQTAADIGVTRYDLYLELHERNNEILARCHFSTDLFDVETIKRMVGHWKTLLDAATSVPSLHLSELPLLTESERRQLAKWNDTTIDYPRDRCVHELFEIQSQRTPDAVALLFEAQEVTYRELDERSNQVGRYLQKCGVSTGSTVGLCVRRSPDMVVALLGILKAGGAYVPLDPKCPQRRLALMLEDSGAEILVTQRKWGGNICSQVREVYIDADWETIAREESKKPRADVEARDLAYVIYTSGSTGTPKGVEVEHRSVANVLLSMQRSLDVHAKDTLLGVTTLCFDIAGLEIYLPLICGARLVIATEEQARDGAFLLHLIERERATIMQATPQTWRLLIEAGWRGPSDLRILCGGEAFPPALARELRNRSKKIWNVYGPTEATIWSMAHHLTGDETNSIPLGRPIANTQIHVLDASQQVLPVNVAGEIYIGGDGVARGYRNRSQLTAEKFLADPFGSRPSGRLYRTGDVGRYLSDGNIQYLGRRDHQLKVHGFRIELGEIEAVLDSHPAVNQCVVVAREDETGSKRLVAYFEPVPGVQFTIADIRAHLKTQLPEYMIPGAIAPIDALPLTLNGKIDRKALPDAQNLALDDRTALVAPRNEIEQMLAQLWSKVLRVSQVGVHDNFFELGGHSLLAVRIIAEIDKVFNKRLPLATLVESPTIAELAALLRKANWSPSWASLVPLRAGGSKSPLFLMHAHGGNVLEYQPLTDHLDPDQPVYALQARGLDGCITKNRSIEAMAADYIEEIRSLQPDGPYFLGGFCFGGLLAWEAAQQLSAIGQEVALLILIQTMNPTYARFKPEVGMLRQWWYRAFKRIDLERDNLSSRGLNCFAERARDMIDIVGSKASIALDRMTNRTPKTDRLSMPYILEVLRQEHAKSYMKYMLRPYKGTVLLLRARKQLSGLMIDETSGWKEAVAGKLKVCHIPGHQQTMLGGPNIVAVAMAITTELKAVRESDAVAEQVPSFVMGEPIHLAEAR